MVSGFDSVYLFIYLIENGVESLELPLLFLTIWSSLFNRLWTIYYVGGLWT